MSEAKADLGVLINVNIWENLKKKLFTSLVNFKEPWYITELVNEEGTCGLLFTLKPAPVVLRGNVRSLKQTDAVNVN